jgi:tetraacyldisaccharide 4'-kinase
MRAALERTFNALWYERRHAALGWALRPAEWLHTQLAKRNWQRHRAARHTQLPVPVVVVGNIVAGGSGKTPVTQALAIALTARGLKVGIVSRGYGGTVKQATLVDAAQPQRFGDEPCLLAATTHCPVAVARVRSEAVRLLHTQCGVDIVLSDDGMQHASLHRDFELCVIGPRGLGNGRGLPAGPLREPAARLARVDAVLAWLGQGAGQPYQPRPHDEADAKDAQNTLDGHHARTHPAIGRKQPFWVIHGAHSPLQMINGNPAPEGTLQALAAQQKRYKASGKTRLIAAAGLAQPERFYTSLAGAGLVFKTLSVPDHGTLSAAQLARIPSEALLIVTEKDAVKLRHAQLPAKVQRCVRIVPWRVTLPTALVDSIAALAAQRHPTLPHS